MAVRDSAGREFFEVLVVPTDEELEIATQTAACRERAKGGS